MHILSLRMGMTVEHLGKTMSSQELIQWLAFYRLYPFGPDIEDYYWATLSALIVNIANAHAGSRKRVSADDFKVCNKEPKREQTIEEQKAIMRAAFSFK